SESRLEGDVLESLGEPRIFGQQSFADREDLREEGEHDRLEPDDDRAGREQKRVDVEPDRTDLAWTWDQPTSNHETCEHEEGARVRKSQRGLYSSRNRRCRQPSRHVRRWGCRVLRGGDSVVGTSDVRRPTRAALTIISLANSLPV